MKKFLRNIILFILFTVLFYIVCLFFWGRYMPLVIKSNLNYIIGTNGHMYSRLSEVKKQSNIDILFLGSSHAYRGFDPRIFSQHGLKTFNLGSSSQTPIQSNILINRYLEKLNPKIVIYEVYPESFMSDGVESSLDLISNDRNDLYSLKMALKINNPKTYNTYIYGLLCDAFNLNKSFSEPTVKDKDTYISGGFVTRKIDYFKPISFQQKEIKLNQFQLESFSQIASKLKSKNIELLLVYAPIPSSNYNSYVNNSYYDSIMESYSEYYNFNKIITLNDSLHFYDTHHLNQNGVEIFNNKLIEIIKPKINNWK